MKLASTFLFDLAHKLSKSEKRYIKVQHGNGQKDYMKLLEAILKEKYFDENQFKQKNKGANFLKNLPVNKRYLYELLLQSLSRFGEKTIENQVFESFTACRILIDKGMSQAAHKELKKGQDLAEKYELYELQIMLFGLEKRIQSSQLSKSSYNKIDSENIFNKEKDCLAQLANTNEYWYINNRLSQFQMQFQKIQTTDQKKHIREIVKSPKFTNRDLASNFKSQLFFYQANSTYQFMLSKADKAQENNKLFLDFLESKPKFLKLYAERYLATLNNLLIDSFVLGKKDVLKEELNRLETLPSRPEFNSIKNLASRVFRQKYLLQLNWSIRQHEFENASKWIPEVEIGLNKYGKSIEKHHRITLYYLSAYLLFMSKEYDEALKWNNKILNDPKEDVVKEIFYFSRVLHILIHFELKNFDLLDSLLLSTPRYLKARRDIYRTEKALFSFIRKLRNSADKKKKEALFVLFKTKLDKLHKASKEQRVFNFIDLRLWLQNKLKK